MESLAGKRIGLLTASASRLGGGVAAAVAEHAAMLRDLGAEPIVFALDDAFAQADQAALDPAPLRLSRVVGPAQIGFAPGLLRALLGASLDLLHLHGIWMYPSRAGLAWARRTGRPYLISPHGMLDPWIVARGRWKKALARIGYERAGWAASTRLHALTEAEARDIARESGRGDALVVPNAGPPPGPPPGAAREPHILYLGRLHPKKNLGGLLAAWRAAERPGGTLLTIAGWGDRADVAAFRALLDPADPSVRFVGPAHGAAKQRLLETARFAILPSLSEGLPMTILEAWAAGTPTLMSEACHLPQGFADGAALRCGTEPADIAAALGTALALDGPAWRAMASAAQGLAAERFSRAAVAGRWAEIYAGLLR